MDEFFPLQFDTVTELQGVENSADDSEERQTNVANDVSINDEDEQLREAFYGTAQSSFKGRLTHPAIYLCMCPHMAAYYRYIPQYT